MADSWGVALAREKIMRHAILFVALLVQLISAFSVSIYAAEQSPPWESAGFIPTWNDVASLRTITIHYDKKTSTEKNGQRLAAALAKLIPGDRLLIGSGTYAFTRKITLDFQGSEEAPISIQAADLAQPPIITRPDANQNLLNIGERNPARYLKLQGIELIGGSVSVRFGDCQNIWLDQCELHHAEHGGITANTHNTTQLSK